VLGPGTRVGAYEITSQLGEGGMGVVWRATDTHLGRQVAMKMLPGAWADDPDRVVRFEREARLLATLNHPNIAAVYGFEKAGGVSALVMELVDGPTLADRIARGPVPVDEALPIAKQIAEALESAHEQGIIHRDLKPANIKVRPDGAVKVLDFGLAKAMDSRGPAGSGAASTALSQSPTITTPAMTQAGMILGTAAYMSPEQARGKPVDKRADIWAFGCVLYEMLTGRRAFEAEDVSLTLAEVMKSEPDLGALPQDAPPGVRTALRLCLQKSPRQRGGDIAAIRLALEGAFDTPSGSGPSIPTPVLPPWRRVLPLAATAAVAVLATGLMAWSLRPSAPAQPATRFDYVLPEGQQFRNTQRPIVAVAEDGRAFVYTAPPGLYVRFLGDLEPRLIPGTAPALTAFFSPDGQWLAFFTSGELQKVAMSGGPPVTVTQVTGGAVGGALSGSWAPDNTILFAEARGIVRVSSNGGTPELIVPAQEGEQMHGPRLLPAGDAVLFSVTTARGPSRWDQGQVEVHSLTTGSRTLVLKGGHDARYLESGHLVYAVRDQLLAVAFDPVRMTVAGGAVPVAQGVQQPVGVNAAGANYAVSAEGTLVYVSGGVSAQGTSGGRALVWTSLDGTSMPIASIPSEGHVGPRLSPDGRRVLVERGGDIWIYELESGRSSRLTRDGSSQHGVWDPTGSQVAYASARGGNLEAWVQPADGSAPPRQLTRLGGQVHVDAWSPDGRILTIHHHPQSGGSVPIFTVTIDQVDAKPEPLVTGDFNAEGAQFSRDGRYVAFLSTETGQREIYIRPYQEPGGR
jgi:serine/threonine-protein kinase